MPFVLRDGQGNPVSLFNNPQPNVEGLEEITELEMAIALEQLTAPRPQPNWEGLIMAIAGDTALKAKLYSSAHLDSRMALMMEIHNPSPRFSIVKLHWDNTIAGLPSPLTSEERAEWEAVASVNHIPWSLDGDGKLVG